LWWCETYNAVFADAKRPRDLFHLGGRTGAGIFVTVALLNGPMKLSTKPITEGADNFLVADGVAANNVRVRTREAKIVHGMRRFLQRRYQMTMATLQMRNA
jgi:hypothetical protein